MKVAEIKPHHVVDILKLYGKGIQRFVPDKQYGHDFYKVGNMLLTEPETQIVLTSGLDEICGPCKFNNGKECVDKVALPSETWDKEELNRETDRKLLKVLNKTEGNEVNMLEFVCFV